MSRWDRWDHHPPCPGGCGELADECMTPGCGSPLGSMRIEEPVGSDKSRRGFCELEAPAPCVGSPGCCTDCAGTGHSVDGLCWECRGTGHPHPQPDEGATA